MTAIGFEPEAASFVMAVCRSSWKSRVCTSMPAAVRAALRASEKPLASKVVPFSG